MICPACSRQNEPGSAYCIYPECGSRLTVAPVELLVPKVADVGHLPAPPNLPVRLPAPALRPARRRRGWLVAVGATVVVLAAGTWFAFGRGGSGPLAVSESPSLSPEPSAVSFSTGDAASTANCPKGIAWASDSKHGKAADFKGPAQFCVSGSAVVDTTRSYSVSAWVRLTVAPDGDARTAVAQDGNNASGFYLQYSGYHRKWVFNWMGADIADSRDNVAAKSSAEVTGEWTHLTGTFDAATRQIQIYLNGIPGEPATTAIPWAATGPLTIGRGKWNGGGTDYWRGQITAVKVWQRALTPAEAAEVAAQRG